MNEAMQQEIVQRRQSGMSVRGIARELGIARGAVTRALARVQAQRTGRTASAPRPGPRPSIIDPFEPILRELLDKYPNLTTERACQDLRARGFRGGYTIVHRRMRRLRPRAAPAAVPRFETGPGFQAQMDFGVYDIDFRCEGRRRVYLFSYLLGYSRRQYLRFVEAMDMPTTLRKHVRAFHHLGGLARVCLYDNFKVVVLRHDADGVFYNPRFLAFATHYGFRPQACQMRRPQTKGKVERRFFYVETSLLNGRTFDTLEHLNETTAWWLANVAEVRVLRDFKESPLERHQREQPHLLALPTCDFDTAQVVYRHVSVEGYIRQRLNLYSVPWGTCPPNRPRRISIPWSNPRVVASVAYSTSRISVLLTGGARNGSWGVSGMLSGIASASGMVSGIPSRTGADGVGYSTPRTSVASSSLCSFATYTASASFSGGGWVADFRHRCFVVGRRGELDRRGDVSQRPGQPDRRREGRPASFLLQGPHRADRHATLRQPGLTSIAVNKASRGLILWEPLPFSGYPPPLADFSDFISEVVSRLLHRLRRPGTLGRSRIPWWR
jgi:transposase